MPSSGDRSAGSAAPAGELACLDGEIRPSSETFVPATDEGLLRGDGAFEVIRVYSGTPFALDDHLDRLGRSARGLRLEGPVSVSRLMREATDLLAARSEAGGGGAFDGLLRIVVTRGGRRLLLTEPLPPTPERVRLGFVTYAPTRVLDGIKSLSYAANMLATRLARERGFDEALLVTPHGRALEAPTSTIFWAGDDGRLATPPLGEQILASITRERVIGLVAVEEREATKEDLLAAREAFLASTTREVQAVAAIEAHAFEDVGPRTREAASALREHIGAGLR